MTTLRDAAKKALTSLENAIQDWTDEMEYRSCVSVADEWAASAKALRSALEQQEKQDETRDSLERYTQEVRTILNGAAKREWQGLTDYEINNFDLPESGTVTIREFVRIIEAKLKEKNA